MPPLSRRVREFLANRAIDLGRGYINYRVWRWAFSGNKKGQHQATTSHSKKPVKAMKQLTLDAPMKRKADGQPYVTIKKRKVTYRHATQANGQNAIHNDMSKMWLRKTFRKAVRSYKRLRHAVYIAHCRNALLTANEGTQFHQTHLDIINRTQLLNNVATPSGASAFTTGLFNQSPDGKLSGDLAAVPIAAGSTPTQRKLHIRKIYGTISYLNLENVSVEMSLYVMECVRTTAANPDVMWYNAAFADGEGLPTGGLSGYGTNAASEGQPNPDFYGESPFRYKEFRKFWRPAAVKKFVLEPGEVKKIDVTLNYNKTFDFASVQTDTNLYQPGMLSTLLIARGQIVGLAPNGTSPGTPSSVGDISYAKVHVGFVSRLAYDTVFPAKAETVSVSRVYCNVPQTSGGSAAQEETIDVKDQIVGVQSA